MLQGEERLTDDRKRDSEPPKRLLIYIAGAGARQDGKGSGFAWLCVDTNAHHVEYRDGLTSNEAVYLALAAAVDEARQRLAPAEIRTDSELVANQFSGNFKVRNPRLSSLLMQIRGAIERNQLQISVTWIPRQDNVAEKIL